MHFSELLVVQLVLGIPQLIDASLQCLLFGHMASVLGMSLLFSKDTSQIG